jgi:hypothetical protein
MDEASKSVLRVFVSYRREDSRDVAGRIYDRLVGHLGSANVFKDVDSIPLGVDFRTHIQEAVERCDVLLAVIGPVWSTVMDPQGSRRLDDRSDFVRLEIAAALERGIRVIPLLVGGATMPRDVELPEEIRDLAFRNAAPVRADPDFHRDMDRLIHALCGDLDVESEPDEPNLQAVPRSIGTTTKPRQAVPRDERAESRSPVDLNIKPYRYDIFLSFAPEDRAWTMEQLYEPLSNSRDSDGRPLQICLDWKDREIDQGIKSMSGLNEAISASRWSVVVVSNTYLDRSMARWRLSRMAHLEGAEDRVMLVFRDPAPEDDLPLSPTWLENHGVEGWAARAVDARKDGFLKALVLGLGIRRG